MERWNIIVITCSDASLAAFIEDEVKCLQRRNIIPQIPVLAVEDPSEHIGSGAATVNGLLVAAEYLCALKNYTVVNADVLTHAHVLIFHQGRGGIYSPCGKSLITVPNQWLPNSSTEKPFFQDDVTTNLHLLLKVIEDLSKHSPPGVWICSSDMSLLKLSEGKSIDWKTKADVVLFGVPTTVDYALEHGLIETDKNGHVASIVYCGSLETVSKHMRTDEHVIIVSGLIFLSTNVADNLVSLHSVSPLESCTYIGLDSGADPVQMSLYFDILMSMASKISREEFLNGKYGKKYNMKAGYSEGSIKKMVMARTLVWEKLSKFKMSAEILENFSHLYWSDQVPASRVTSNYCHVTHESFTGTKCLKSGKHLVKSFIDVNKGFAIGNNSLILNSDVSSNMLKVGTNCLISGIMPDDFPNIELNIPDNICVFSLDLPDDSEESVIITFGCQDHLTLQFENADSTFANSPWSDFFKRLKISPDDLWDKMEPSKRNLLNAKIFSSTSCSVNFLFLVSGTAEELENMKKWKASKRFSIAQLLKCVNYKRRLSHNRNVYKRIAIEKVRNILLANEDCCMLHYFDTAVAEGWSEDLLETLDSILLSETHYIILTRSLSAMADLLARMAGKSGGLRTGPGSNRSWSAAFKFLLEGDITKGIAELMCEREKWLVKPSFIMRAARHYERAVQILIQNCLQSSKKFLALTDSICPDIGDWMVVECPARIDLQGGWTDTPPICYELGGSVVNVAILVDGQKPISAKARRKIELNIELVYGPKDAPTHLVVADLADIMDFNQPFAQGALLKAALICASIVDPNSNLSLKDQLVKCCCSGLEIHAYSDLPHGCGLGTSSILAGAIITALWCTTGKHCDKHTVIHAVLHIEQLLTTGGGWQDQVGGVMGGINRAFSKPELPLHVGIHTVSVTEKEIKLLNEHLILVYTGKARLAKNILQNVIRNWYARDATIVRCFKDLLAQSCEMEQALSEGDLFRIGNLMNKYWTLKKILAPGCEPEDIKTIMEVLSPACHGQMLVGAGGGGYLCAVTKQPCAKESIKYLLSNVKITSGVTCHSVTLNLTGMTIRKEK